MGPISLSVEPLVCRVKRRHDKVENLQIPHRPMAATGPDGDRGEWLEGNAFAVQFQETFTLDDDIRFRQPLMIMRLRIGGNVGKVDA